MGLLKKRKAQEHIETVLAFTIFVGFLIALLLFFNPVRQSSSSLAVLDDVQTKIMKNISGSYSILSLIISETANLGSCFSVVDIVGFGSKVWVINSKRELIASSMSSSGKNLNIAGTGRYYVIYFNSTDNFNSPALSGNCNPLGLEDYDFGIINSETSVMFERLLELNESYTSDYNKLKTDLGVNGDFSFVVLNETNGIIMQQSIQRVKGLNVLSRSVPILAVDKNLQKKQIILNLQVW